MMSNIQKKTYSLDRQRGFSLIELLVASAIGVVILLAAGSTYFSTFRLKQQVQTRVEYEQDIRATANLMRMDARQADNYSCMANPTAAQLNTGSMAGAFANLDNKQSISTTLPTSFTADQQGLTPDSGSVPLIMTYASEGLANSVLANGTNSCGSIISGRDTLNGVVYVVATAADTGNKGLYRVPYINGETKNLSGAQLLLDNVVSMKQEFQYDGFKSSQCPLAPNDDDASLVWKDAKPVPDLANGEAPKTNLDFTFDNPPILISTKLTTCPNGMNPGNSSCTNNKPPVTYVIKSMVRQGEVCAKQSLNI